MPHSIRHGPMLVEYVHQIKLGLYKYDINGNKLREFPSLTDAAEFVGLSGTSGIAKCCKGKRRSAGGYLWRYKEL